jgi:hypothetical protein
MCQEQMKNKIQLDKPCFSVYTNTRCMGRPPKPEHLRRSKLFPLRLTPAEFAHYERAARRLGVTVAEMFREGAGLYIQKRGKDGSPKKETKR